MYIKDKSFILNEKSKIFDVIENLNNTGYLITLIADSSNKLLGTITDGDIRRGLLAGKTVDDFAMEIIIPNPVVSYVDYSDDHNKNLSMQHQVKQIPIVDNQNNIHSLFIWEEHDHVEKEKIAF